MGVPKFFRWVSERYPLCSQLIAEGSIPQFDNLYLDMNGIIHNCSHNNSEDVHKRIREEDIFVNIFAYIEHLFSKIKPRKTFFMAIDGVAPRAKMNQQRSRRFRTAKEAQDLRDQAVAKGEELPAEPPFDSNCITPGTPFMARLSEQLKYFVAKKVNEDANWRDIEVILSGHEVPGEGEHKIMEYIRLAKAQPGYNPNLRHCLYGLDADLIMLGLLSHDPHFCLLREEVLYGPQRKKAKASLEAQNFYLMHLSLFREYLDLEFSSLDASGSLPFEYDLERIIDDWILLVIFVGNDFLPHLPGIHIHEGALTLLYDIYKRVLPKAGGYINEHGKLNTARLQLVLNELSSFERDQFEEEYADSNWFKGKQQTHVEALEKARNKAKLTLSPAQRDLFNKIKDFLEVAIAEPTADHALSFPATYPARDRRFLQGLADQLRLSIAFDEFNDNDEPIIVLRLAEEMVDMITTEEEDLAQGMAEVDLDDDEDDEWREAINRVLEKYEKAPVIPDRTEQEFEEQYEAQFQEKMNNWKQEYYREKLEFDFKDPVAMRSIAFHYIEGLQWVLHYYYDGVASWGWYYPYHYSPKISDLKDIASFDFNYELGIPFKPFQQLMGVLPHLSVSLIPPVYRDLMLDPTSPIIDFYPRNFASDLNGKKQDWEAVVKIPFIDEKRLLKAMGDREPKLTDEERRRNSWGNSWRVTFDPNRMETYPSSLPSFFPDLHNCQSRLEVFNLPTLEGLHLVKGLCEGVLLGKDAVAGFPSLFTLPHTGQLGYAGVKVFPPTESKNETMVITIDNPFEGAKPEDLAKALIGKSVYTDWPFLKESQVVAVSDDLFRYEMDGQHLANLPHRPDSLLAWRKSAERLEYNYSKRCGVTIGTVEVMVHTRPLLGLKLLEDGALVKDFDNKEIEHSLQTTVENVSSVDPRYIERPPKPIEEDYPIGSKVFSLVLKPAYGSPAAVIKHNGPDTLSVQVAYFPSDPTEHLHFRAAINSRVSTQYTPTYIVSRKLKMSGLTLSKITSSLMLFGPKDSKVNAGLNLKFDAKNQKVLGYSRKTDNGWEFSEKAIELISDYQAAFPEIVDALNFSSGKRDLKQVEDIFTEGTDLQAKMKEIKLWLRDNNVENLERVALTADQLESDTVKMYEIMADTLNSQKRSSDMKIANIQSIPRRGLLKPSHATARLQDQAFQLGDRVAMASETGNVPLAAKGTVVGIQAAALDVVWDVPFIGGTTLGDRCSAFRGQVVASDTILNISTPQLVAVPRRAGDVGTGVATRGGALPPSRGARGGRGSARGRGVGPIPGPVKPPVHDYRGAATGQRAANNQPTHTDSLRSAITGAPAEPTQPPQFRYNNYQSVPPPATLNAPSRGRGGFRGGHRGGSGRGGGGHGGNPSANVPLDPAIVSQGPMVSRGGPRGRRPARGGVPPRGRGQVNGH